MNRSRRSRFRPSYQPRSGGTCRGWLGRRVVAALLALVVTSAVLTSVQVRKAHGDLLFDIDLVRTNGVSNRSQRDYRWGDYLVGPEQDTGGTDVEKTHARCGCALAVMSTILTYELGSYGRMRSPWVTRPKFPVQVNDGKGGSELITDWVPPYIDVHARRSGDYKNSNACGNHFDPWALDSVGIPTEVYDPDTGNLIVRTNSGISLDFHPGGLPKALIDLNLQLARPVPVIKTNSVGGGHMQLIVGREARTERYLIIDPLGEPGASAFVPNQDGQRYPDPAEGYAAWENGIRGVYTYETVKEAPLLRYLAFRDDPAPLGVILVGPDGRRTGLDPVTGSLIDEIPGAQYIEDGAWADPLGTIPSGDPAKMLAVRNPGDGTYRFQVTGTGSGDAPYQFLTVEGGVKTTLADIGGAIAGGEQRKYEMKYSATGPSSTVAVSNFTPEARIHSLQSAVTRSAVQFDGGGSFDVDGNIVSHEWDFGDGTVGAGSTASHVYERAGSYTVKLTVSDDTGRQGTSTSIVEVRPADALPPTSTVSLSPDANGEGWNVGEATVSITATDNPNGSGVASITYGASGAQQIPTTTISEPAAAISIAGEGETTVEHYATDADGNREPTRTTVVRIDGTAPASRVRTPSEGSTLPGLSFLAGTADGTGSRPAAVQAALQRISDGAFWDGAGWVPVEAWLATAGSDHWYRTTGLPAGDDLPPGSYTVTSRSVDQAGNVEAPQPASRFSISPSDTSGVEIVEVGRASAPGEAVALSSNGDVVGWTDGFSMNRERAFQWSGGTLTDLAPLPGPAGCSSSSCFRASKAWGIGTNGDVVGVSVNGLGSEQATLWRGGEIIELPAVDKTLFRYSSQARDVNGSGVVAGSSSTGNGRHAVIWRDGVPSDLGTLGGPVSFASGINDSGAVVGQSNPAGPDSGSYHAFLWEPSVGMRDLGTLGGNWSSAIDVNNAGQVVGSAATASGELHAVLWTAGTITDLGPGAAIGINDHGQIVGRFLMPDGQQRAGFWEKGVVTDLNALLPVGSGWSIVTPRSVNAEGQVAGTGTKEGLKTGFRLVLSGSVPGSDTVAPQTTASLSPALNEVGWSNSDVEVTLRATDEGGAGVSDITHTRSDTGPIQDDIARFTIADEGETPVTFYATDQAGNLERPPSTVLVRIDKTPPWVAASQTPEAGSAGWHNRGTTVRLAAGDPTGGSGVANITYHTEGAQAAGPTTIEGSMAEVIVSGEGETTIVYSTKDRAGNASPPQRLTVHLDNSGPLISSYQPEGSSAQRAEPLIFEASDQLSGVSSVKATLEHAGTSIPVEVGHVLRQHGAHRLTVEAIDTAGNRTSLVKDFEVEGSEGPLADLPLAGNHRPEAHAGGPFYSVAPNQPAILDGSLSTDHDGDLLTYRWDFGDGSTGTGTTPTHIYPRPGRYFVTLTVNDGKQNSLPEIGSRSFALVSVEENRPPDCTAGKATPESLWPPNHSLRPVNIAGATDPEGGLVSIKVTGVTQDEPVNDLGDGRSSPDAELGTEPNQVKVRAERSGTGDGRVYRISFTATDPAGASCAGVALTGVPHDEHGSAVDSGVSIPSTASP